MSYVTGKTIKELREKRKLTQRELAEAIQISDKAVSKWETGRGLPDIGIIEDLAKALGVSIAELLTGDCRENENMSGNMKKVHFYVCPVCGNIITSVGCGSFNCCGILLPEQEPEKMDDHQMIVETIDNEYCVTMDHAMTKAIIFHLLLMQLPTMWRLSSFIRNRIYQSGFVKKGMAICMAIATGMVCSGS